MRFFITYLYNDTIYRYFLSDDQNVSRETFFHLSIYSKNIKYDDKMLYENKMFHVKHFKK